MYCGNCGNKLNDSDNFCCRCGTKCVHPALAKRNTVQLDSNQPFHGSYEDMRNFEEAWLEKHYDFNSLKGINAIPEKRPKRPPIEGITGDVYYYLRRKGYQHEDAGNIDLAIACLRKSVAILKNSEFFSAEEAYPLVKVLARAGYIEEAYQEKAAIDNYASSFQKDLHKCIDTKNTLFTNASHSDLVIMDAHGSTCPECAKYQGRVYSISGKSKRFPKVPDFYFALGGVHQDCSHTFWPYIEGISDSQLEYTLSVHPLKDKRYGKNIVAFSNRPFVDDRTEECKQASVDACEARSQKIAKQRYYRDHMIEIEAVRGQEARDFAWLQTNLPDKCPKSLSGYRRMKNQNTKNYQALKQAAAELGREI